jgi:hypothetical protein
MRDLDRLPRGQVHYFFPVFFCNISDSPELGTRYHPGRETDPERAEVAVPLGNHAPLHVDSYVLHHQDQVAGEGC